MTHRPGTHPRITREELDRLFDRELDGGARRDLVGRIGRDPDALDEVNDVRGMIHSMRLREGEAPDLTGAVLGQLDHEQGFLSPRLRRRVKSGRLAAAACLLTALLGVAVAQRVAPDRFRLHDRATPVADLTEAVQRDSIEGKQRLASAVIGLASAHAEIALCDGPERRAAMPSGAGVLRSMGTPENPGLAVPVPTRYLTLAVSADAEVLALDGESPLPSEYSFVVSIDPSQNGSGGQAASAFGLAQATFAPTQLAVIGQADPAATSAPAPIQAGVLPLSFSRLSRSAYVGRRHVFPQLIEHEAEVSTLEDRR